MIKRQMYYLLQKQSLPLESKVRMTQERIKEWYNHFDGEVYVSFSGGKDSTVLLHICRELFPDIEAVFIDTGLEYPEIKKFVKNYDNVTWLRPLMWDNRSRKYKVTNFREVIEKYGYPVISKEVSQCVEDAKTALINKRTNRRLQKLRGTYTQPDGSSSSFNIPQWGFLLTSPFKISSKCCEALKKTPAKLFEKTTGKKPIIATMAVESRQRKLRWLSHGCNSFDSSRPCSNPMSFWTEQDVLNYLVDNDIRLAECYGKIVPVSKQRKLVTVSSSPVLLTTEKCKRTGCMFCMFGAHKEQEPNRFQTMKITHPKQYEYCMRSIGEGGLGLKEVLTFLNIPYL